MKSVIDYFGNFSKNEQDLRALSIFLFVVTDLLLEKGTLTKENLIKHLKNNAMALEGQGDDKTAKSLRDILSHYN